MLITYIAILISIYVICTSFIELMQLIIYGELKQKKSVIRYFQTLQPSLKEKKRKNWKGTTQQEKLFILFSTGMITAALFLFGLLIFKNLLYTFLFALLGFLYPKLARKKIEEKKQEQIVVQFRDAILSISNSLKAGSSLQVALFKAEADLKQQLKNEKAKPMLEELQKINQDIRFGISVEEALRRFSQRAKAQDITQFVNAVLIVKEKGGNLTEVIQNTTKIISDKITVQQDIKVATSQKRMEAKLLTYMPVTLVLIIMFMNPGYMSPMYESWIGSTLLFIAALMLMINYFVGKKITDIKI